MNFTDLVQITLYPFLYNYGFEKTKDIKNIIELESYNVSINISYNSIERNCLFEIGYKGEFLYPFNDEIIKLYFDSDLRIDNIYSSNFIQNIYLLLNSNKGIAILQGNLKEFIGLSEKMSANYTSNIVISSKLMKADIAWSNKNMCDFIEILDEIEDKSYIPKSYFLKYKIAKRKNK